MPLDWPFPQQAQRVDSPQPVEQLQTTRPVAVVEESWPDKGGEVDRARFAARLPPQLVGAAIGRK